MASTVPPHDMADAFVKQYYTILNSAPENSHKFYAESSHVGWPDCNGVITDVTTLSSISDKILSSDYKNCVAEVNTVEAQASHDGGLLVSVTGSFLEKGEVKNLFFQTFYLATQANGFFILNDVLRVFQASVVDDAPASDNSVLEDTVAKVSSSASLVDSDEVAPVVPATSANVPTGIDPSAIVNVSPAVAPADEESAPSTTNSIFLNLLNFFVSLCTRGKNF